MGKIVKLRPREATPSPHREAAAAPGQTAVEQLSFEAATQRLMASVGELIRTLEASHKRIRVLIDAIPDPEAAARLSRDHAVLSAALREAKAKVAALGLSDQPADKR